jgi:hypothetical protein
MNDRENRADSIEDLRSYKAAMKRKFRGKDRKVTVQSDRVVTGKLRPNLLNQRFNESLVATPRKNVRSYSSMQSQLNKRNINCSDLKSIKSGSVVISIMDGILRVMDGSNCMYEQHVSYKTLSYARSVKASHMIVVSNDTQPFGFVSSVFDTNGPVCFWRTMKCNDTIVLIFWGKHE